MPVYEFECQSCGTITDHCLPIAHRLHSQDCPECGTPQAAKLVMSAPHYAGERITGDKRLIWDEKQVAAEKGKRWRQEGTTGKEGGAGKTMYFH